MSETTTMIPLLCPTCGQGIAGDSASQDAVWQAVTENWVRPKPPAPPPPTTTPPPCPGCGERIEDGIATKVNAMNGERWHSDCARGVDSREWAGITSPAEWAEWRTAGAPMVALPEPLVTPAWPCPCCSATTQPAPPERTAGGKPLRICDMCGPWGVGCWTAEGALTGEWVGGQPVDYCRVRGVHAVLP